MIFTTESEHEYHEKSLSGKYLSSHLLADFRKCPELYYKKTHGLIVEEERPAYLIGRATHCLVLEGREAFDKAFAVGGPINPKTGKPYGTATQAFAEWAKDIGKPVISDADFAAIEILATSVRNHTIANNLLAHGAAEQVCRALYVGVDCQCRVDWANPMAGIVDLKTCDDLAWFEADARRYGYAHQLAFYQSVISAHPEGEKEDVYMIAVEKKEPHRTGVWKVAQDVLDAARGENEISMDLFLYCRTENKWPTGYETLRVFETI